MASYQHFILLSVSAFDKVGEMLDDKQSKELSPVTATMSEPDLNLGFWNETFPRQH